MYGSSRGELPYDYTSEFPSQLSDTTNQLTRQPSHNPPPPSSPTQPICPMAEEFVSAFHDPQTDATNYEKLVEFVRSYYVNNLNAFEFYSALQLLLRHEKRLNDPVQNFFHNISCLLIKHLMMEMELKSMNESFTKQLHSIAVSKKLYSVLFTAAATLCAAVAAIAVANVIPMRGWARAWVGAVAAAAPILFTALGDWRRSILMKRETALNKQRDIIVRMLIVARPIITDLNCIYEVARNLEFEIKSLLEAVDDGEKAAAVENCFVELLQNDEKYNSVMNWAKELVLQSIVNQMG